MNCKNCGNPLEQNAQFCNACGTPVQTEQMPVNNETTISNVTPTKKKNNMTLILILIIVILLAVGIGGYLLYSKEDKETTPSTEPAGNLIGIANVVKQDGDYKSYELTIENRKANEKYDFKVGNHTITFEFEDDEYGVDIKKYVDNNFIFNDEVAYSEIEEAKPNNTYSTYINTLGEYIFIEDSAIMPRSNYIYVVSKSGNLENVIRNFDLNGLILIYYDYDFDATGLTVKGDLSRHVLGYVEVNGDDIFLCNKAEWPENFTDESIYSATYKYEYSNGILDLNAKLLESQTVSEMLQEYELENNEPLCPIE